MSEQLNLVDQQPKLTDRQERALEIIRAAGRDGIPSDEFGQQIHAWQGKHDLETLCEWCPTSGRELGKALRKKGLVKSRRDGHWYALDGIAAPVEDPDVDPFPPGF
jgi:hypothetical protein